MTKVFSLNNSKSKRKFRVVIVGGGAGGLELAVRLARSRFFRKKINICLVDESLKYIWKPLYHEVAVGTIDYSLNEVNYITYSHQKNFRYIFGSFSGLDREHKKIIIAPVLDENDKMIIPARKIRYDLLIIAVGSVSNTFGIPGVKEHCYFLDRLSQAERFQKNFLYKILEFIQVKEIKKPYRVTIVGGGATGVELAAELRYALSLAISYGARSVELLNRLEICIIEGADRLLPNLSEYISKKVRKLLSGMDICILTGQRVVRATSQGVETNRNEFIQSDVTVWAAGIKAPDFLGDLGLPCNNLNQLIVNNHLQSIDDTAIFAFGDCAACSNPDTNTPVPPRAQAARQQAKLLTKTIKHYLKGEPLPVFRYNDQGSLVSLSKGNVVGNLMGRVLGPFFIEGEFALLSYWLLHKMHQSTLFGPFKTLLLTISNLFTRKIKSGIKLH